jgi:hypothetical protein
MSNRMTLVRLLFNQASRAEQAGDTLRAMALYERMTVMAPDHDAGWWELARLQLVHLEVDKARASLGAMLEVTRDIERRAHIHAALAPDDWRLIGPGVAMHSGHGQCEGQKQT